jgi:tetratricopeptide (TPR) repeat protein
VAVTLTPSVSAQNQFTQDELRALPRVCHAQKFISEALRPPIVPEQERRQWEARLGERDYLGFHHHCYALMFLRRASVAESETSRDYNYQQAVANFLFVQNHCSRKFPLLPEVNLRKGQTLRLMGKNGDAATEFWEAVNLKPDYTPAYAALIDLYIDLRDSESAEQVLEQGLARVPQSKILLQKKLEFEARPQSTK